MADLLLKNPKGSAKYWKLNKSYKRPGISEDVTTFLFKMFIQTDYAKDTSLAEFVSKHKKGFTDGILNQLHRRHIISFDCMKWMIVALANAKSTNNPPHKDVLADIKALGTQFGVSEKLTVLWNADDNSRKASDALEIIKTMCWHPCNIFIGPSDGNTGTDVDIGDDKGLSESEAADLLKGKGRWDFYWKALTIQSWYQALGYPE